MIVRACAVLQFANKVSIIRAIKPEASVVLSDFKKEYTLSVGGLLGQTDFGFVNGSDQYTSDPNAFQFSSYQVFLNPANFAPSTLPST